MKHLICTTSKGITLSDAVETYRTTLTSTVYQWLSALWLLTAH